MGYKFGGRQAGSKNKKTVERENLLSRAIGELNRPLGKDVLAEVMMTLRGMAHDLAEAARAGDKEAQQKRVYYQGTLETDKGELSGSSATGGATVSGARRKDARPSALSVSPIIRVEIAGRDRIARAQRAIGEIDRPLGQEMLAKAMMKFHELARRLAEEIGGRGPLVSAPRRFVHAPAN